MKTFRIMMLLLLTLWVTGCGTQLIQTSELILPPEEEEAASTRRFRLTSGTVRNYLFTAGPGYNGVVPPVDAQSELEGEVVLEGPGNSVRVILRENLPSNQVRQLALTIEALDEALEPGRSYNLVVDADQVGSHGVLTDFTIQGLNQVLNQVWRNSSNSQGSITLVDLSETTLQIVFDLQVLEPDPAPNTGNAQGSFTVSGEIQATLEEEAP